MLNSSIKNIVIAGAGLMGASMAQIFAQHGYKVVVYDIYEKGIQNGKKLIEINQKTSIDEEVVTESQSREIIDNISFSTDIDCFKEADFAIEAIVENLSVKQEFWKDVSALAPINTVLATNTSGLSITEIAKTVNHPDRFAGMHWVNPPHIVPLVEIISGDDTSPEAVEIIRDLAFSIKKVPVFVKKDAKGFVLNRLQYAVLREALNIVENDIASIEDVDNVMKYGLGMRYACIGPFQTVDLGGLDTFYKVGSYLFADLSDQKDVPALLKEKFEKNAFGVKTGQGFYDYSDGKDEEVIEKRDKDFIKIAKCLYSDL